VQGNRTVKGGVRADAEDEQELEKEKIIKSEGSIVTGLRESHSTFEPCSWHQQHVLDENEKKKRKKKRKKKKRKTRRKKMMIRKRGSNQKGLV